MHPMVDIGMKNEGPILKHSDEHSDEVQTTAYNTNYNEVPFASIN
jgi:hypothetical protein